MLSGGLVHLGMRIAFVFILCTVWMGWKPLTAQQVIPSMRVDALMKRVKQSSDTVFVVNFWATFCKPCIEEIPDLEAAVREAVGRPVKLLLVSVDQKSFFPTKLQQFVSERKFESEVIWLNETNADYFCPAVDDTWSGAIPATLVVAPKKGAREFFEAPLTKQDMACILAKFSLPN